MIPHSRPLVGSSERAAVTAVIDSGHLSGGWEFSSQLERRLADLSHRPSAVAVSSGSLALELALRCLGVSGQQVVIPAYSCLSVERAVRRAGAVPRLIDVDPSNLSGAVGATTEASAACGAVVTIHQFGIPAGDLEEAAATGLPLVEDFTTVIGGTRRGKPLGSAGGVSVLSLGATKMLCAGEGGALLTDEPTALLARRWINPESDLPLDAPVSNNRMGQLPAAVALAQVDRLPAFLERRRNIAEHYADVVNGLGVEFKRASDGDEGTWWRFLVALPAGRAIDDVREAALSAGVRFARPVPQRHWSERGTFPVSDRLYESLVSIPIYPGLSDSEVDQVAQVLRKVI